MHDNIVIRILLLTLLAMSPVITQAGNGMSDDQAQKMMDQAKKMQKCMADIDQGRLKALSTKAKGMQQKIRELCTAGERDRAQDVAIKYGKEISDAPVMKEMKKCTEMAKGMTQMPMMSELQKDYANGHVCDNM